MKKKENKYSTKKTNKKQKTKFIDKITKKCFIIETFLKKKIIKLDITSDSNPIFNKKKYVKNRITETNKLIKKIKL